MINDFDEFYRRLKLKKENETIELEKKIKKKAYISILIILIVGIIISILTKFIFMVVTVIICIIVFICMYSNNKERKTFYKSQIVGEIINNFNEYELKYYPSQGIEEQTYNDVKYEDYDSYSSEDLIVGRINQKYNLNISEVHTSKTTIDEENQEHTTIQFWGIFGVLELDKSINTWLKLLKNGIYSIGNRKDNVELDSSEFEKYFDVGCDNRMLTMQIFTSDIMEKIVNIYESDVFKKKKRFPEINFKDNKIYIRISTGNFLDAKAMKDMLDYEIVKDEYNLLQLTIKLLEMFANKLEEIL